MVKRTIRAKKYTPRTMRKKKYIKKYQKKGVSLTKPLTFATIKTQGAYKKSLRYHMLYQSTAPLDYVPANPVTGAAAQVSPASTVMLNLLGNSAVYGGMTVMMDSIIVLGSSDLHTTYNRLNDAILAKHEKLFKTGGLQHQAYRSSIPIIEYRGISIKVLGSIVNPLSTATHAPMLFYQHYIDQGLVPVVFPRGKVYIKFPMRVDGNHNKRQWPIHLCLFNVGLVKFKVYYRVLSDQGVIQNIGNVGAALQPQFAPVVDIR